jgi:electron transport complex protein RnfC
VKTFKKGGIHPDENKFAHNSPFEDFPLPKQAVLYATQHLGAPSVVVVSKGDMVKTGQLIAKGEAFISANLHSPYTGTVSKVEPVADISGYKKMAITIDVAEEEQWEDEIDTSFDIKRDFSLSPSEIIAKIKEKGIVGLGGACFPTHIKLMVPEGKKAEYCIINAAECEPYISVDNRIMLERTEEFLIGACILRSALGLSTVDIGVEHNKPEAIAKLKEVAAGFSGINIHTLKPKYPQGAEKQLIKAITNREVPTGKLPIDVGCVVDNVATALSVYEAVQKNKPLIIGYLTYSGKSVTSPKNYVVRLGTPINEIIEANGGLASDTEKVVSGGPMMGKAVANLNAYITKGFSSLLQINEKEAKRLETVNCIRCSKCVEVCPMGLEPYFLAPLAENNRWEDTEREQIMSCIECGSCQFTCPANRPLLDYIRLGKNKTGAMIRAKAQK